MKSLLLGLAAVVLLTVPAVFLAPAGSDFHGPTTKPAVSLGGIKGNSLRYLEELKRHYEAIS